MGICRPTSFCPLLLSVRFVGIFMAIPTLKCKLAVVDRKITIILFTIILSYNSRLFGTFIASCRLKQSLFCEVYLRCLFLGACFVFSSALSASPTPLVEQLFRDLPELVHSEQIHLQEGPPNQTLKIDIRIQRAGDVGAFAEQFEAVIREALAINPQQRFQVHANFSKEGVQYYEFESDRVFELDENRHRLGRFDLDQWLASRRWLPTSKRDLVVTSLRFTVGSVAMFVAAAAGAAPLETAWVGALSQAALSASFAVSPKKYIATILSQQAPDSPLWSYNYLGMAPLELFAKYVALELAFNIFYTWVGTHGTGYIASEGLLPALGSYLLLSLAIAHAQLFVEVALTAKKDIRMNRLLDAFAIQKSQLSLGEAMTAEAKIMNRFNWGALLASATSVVAMSANAIGNATGDPLMSNLKASALIALAGTGIALIAYGNMANESYIRSVAQWQKGMSVQGASFFRTLVFQFRENHRIFSTPSRRWHMNLLSLIAIGRTYVQPLPTELKQRAKFFEELIAILNRYHLIDKKSCRRSLG